MAPVPDSLSALPIDWPAATLLGRAWIPGSPGGPSPISVRPDGTVVDLAHIVPTVSAWLERIDVASAVHSAQGTSIGKIEALLANSHPQPDPTRPWLLAPCASAQPIGVIDQPTQGQRVSGVVKVSGWVLDFNAIDKIELLVDGTFANRADTNLPRADVLEVFPTYFNSATPNPGYVSSFLANPLSNGPHAISIRVTESSPRTPVAECPPVNPAKYTLRSPSACSSVTRDERTGRSPE